MSDSESDPQINVFDLKRLEEIVQLMKEHELSEVDLTQGEQSIRLMRGGVGSTVPVPAPILGATPVTPPLATEEEAHIATIKSPMVGTFYSRPNPESEPFVKVGDHVGAETVICIIEAMKVFNEIPADVSGKVVSVLVDNEEAVDHGRALYKIDTRG